MADSEEMASRVYTETDNVGSSMFEKVLINDSSAFQCDEESKEGSQGRYSPSPQGPLQV